VRVLYFSRDYTPHDYRFLTSLVKAGFEVYYLRLERRGHSQEDRALPPEVEQVQWAGGQAPFSWRELPKLLHSLKGVIRRVMPDLVHAGPIQTAAFLAALAGYQPLVTASWGYDLMIDAGRSAWYRWATRYTLRRSAVLVGDCDPIRQKAILYGMRAERIVTFPWGIDLMQFSPGMAKNKKDATFTVLSTRSWEALYGVEVLAKAFAMAAQQRPELRLVMLGNGSQAAQLRQIFERGGVLEQVYFPGQVAQSDLPRYYRSADLYVSASHSDGTSISLLEALACGTPALLSDIPGNREWVQPGVQGWLFPDGDTNALGQALLHAVEQRLQLAEMGCAARRLAEQRADWDVNFQELLRAYQMAAQPGS
jgi:glycosyltransferase involved in cell wall biosynthesis